MEKTNSRFSCSSAKSVASGETILRFPRLAENEPRPKTVRKKKKQVSELKAKSNERVIIDWPVSPGRDGHFRYPRVKVRTTLTELVHRARVMMMGNFQTIRLEMGHVFSRIKRKVQRRGDKWKAFYLNNFNTSIVSYRTACRYMKRWRRARERAKRDRLSSLKAGTSRKSREIDIITAEVKREFLADHVDAPKPEPDYRLSLRRLGPVRRAALILLWKSQYRDVGEKIVLADLDKLLIKYGFTTENELRAEEVAA